MNDMLNDMGPLLSIGASIVAIITGLVSCIHFLRRQGRQKMSSVTLSQSTRGGYYQRTRDIGYHFGCLLKTVIGHHHCAYYCCGDGHHLSHNGNTRVVSGLNAVASSVACRKYVPEDVVLRSKFLIFILK